MVLPPRGLGVLTAFRSFNAPQARSGPAPSRVVEIPNSTTATAALRDAPREP